MQTLIKGHVVYPAGKDFPSKVGGSDYTDILVDIGDGSKGVKVFCNVGTEEYRLAKSYKKGDSVTLSEEKGKYKIVGSGGAMSDAVRETAPQAQPEPQKAFTKAEIKERALKYAELYREIYTDLVLAMPPEQAQLGATAVFNQLSRLFS